MTTTPTLRDVIQLAIDDELADVFTSMPGTVHAYYPEDQSVDIIPGFRRVRRDERGRRSLESLPVLPKVPVLFPQGNGFFLKFALAKGDRVFVVVADQSMGNWFGDQEGLNAPDDSVHSLSGACCFPVTLSRSGPGPFSHLAMGHDSGNQVHIKERETCLTSENPSDFVALESKVNAELDKIRNALTSAGTTSTGGISAVDLKTKLAAEPRQPTGSRKAKSD